MLKHARWVGMIGALVVAIGVDRHVRGQIEQLAPGSSAFAVRQEKCRVKSG